MRTMLRSIRKIAPTLLGILAAFLLLLSFSSARGQEPNESVQNAPGELVSIHSQLAAQPPNPGAGLPGYDELAQAVDGDVVVSLNHATGVAGFVRMLNGASLSAVPNGAAEAQAEAFLEQYGSLFGAPGADSELVLVDTRTDYLGQTHLTYQQIYKGVPVFAGVLKFHFNDAAAITSVNGVFIPDLALDANPSLAAADVSDTAISAVRSNPELDAAQKDLSVLGTNLFVFRAGLVQGVPGPNHLVYEVDVADPAISVREMVYIDAHTGKIVDQISRIHVIEREVSETMLSNVIWDEGNGDPNPIPPGWASGTPQQVAEWQNSVDGAGETYYVFASMNAGTYLSYDGADAVMRTVTNIPDSPPGSCPNAFWNGVSTNFCTNMTADDVVAHEWGHAYTEYTNGLIYQWQSGALNESYSDIWGELVDLLNGRGTDTPGGLRTDGSCSVFGSGSPSVDNTYRWLVGEDASGIGGAIRDMWRPVCYGDPGKVTDQAQYICTTFDNGGVHINSGIPNHAFSLMVDGGTYNSQTVTGIGLTKSAHIHWEAQQMLTPSSDFSDHADALEAACTSLIGTNLPAISTTVTNAGPSGQIISAADCTQVSNAIAAVEFRTEPTFCNFEPLLDPNAPAFCGGGAVQSISSTDFEAGLGSWTVGTRAVANPGTFDTPDWAAVGSLPDGRIGQAAFVADLAIGDCAADDETGVLYLDSPVINIPAGAAFPALAFDHWHATEAGWDGGNVKASVNGGAWTLVPDSAFTFNDYNSSLNIGGNTNPLAGEDGFTGTDGGENSGSWGQSQVDLSGIASPGDDVQLRFELGIDGCNGIIGWYVDDVEVYSCSAPPEPIIAVIPGAMTTTLAADNVLTQTLTISNSGGAALNWSIEEVNARQKTGVPSGGSPLRLRNSSHPSATTPDALAFSPSTPDVVMDGSFEAGSPNPFWSEYSLTFGTPLCTAGLCGTGTGTGPRTGSWWAWFGGIGAYEEGSVTQTVTIANSPAMNLDFYLEQIVCDSASDYIEVKIDGSQVFLSTGSSGLCGTLGYSLQTVDISAYADGGAHTLEFHSEIFAINGGGSNFFVDDISFTVPGICDVPSDIPWLNVDPITGTVAGTSSMPVSVIYDSTGLSTGAYTGTLCVDSNDMMNPLVPVTVTMTVAAPAYGVDLSGPQTLEGAPGKTVTYTVHITNTGNTADVYDLVATGNTWMTTLSASSVPVNVGSTGAVMVSVEIPAGALDGATDMVTIQATSQGNGSETDSTDLTTEVAFYKVRLPFIKKE